MNTIIVTGHPCSGKSSISKFIQTFLNYQILSKDWFKNKIFTECGFNTIEEKEALDFQAEHYFLSSVESMMKQNKNLIIDKWIQSLDYFSFLQGNNDANVIVVRLSCSPDVATQRYNERILYSKRPLCFLAKNIYPVTPDTLYEAEMTADVMEEKVGRPFFKKGVRNYLEVDTTNIQEEEKEIKSEIKAYILERIIG